MGFGGAGKGPMDNSNVPVGMANLVGGGSNAPNPALNQFNSGRPQAQPQLNQFNAGGIGAQRQQPMGFNGGAQQPLGMGAQQPLGMGAQQPVGMRAQQPLGMGAQQPLGMGAQQPLGMGAQQPLGMGAQQPVGMGAQQPLGMGAQTMSAQTPQQQQQYEQHILQQGNDILAALNAEDVITDVSTFQYDVFYIQIFQEILPEMNFEQMQGGTTADEMAANVDSILDFVEKMVPEIDIQILNGDMIVAGDLQQIAMMLELINELILMTMGEEEEEEVDINEEGGQLNAADKIVKEQLMKQQMAAQDAQMQVMYDQTQQQQQQVQQPGFGQQIGQQFGQQPAIQNVQSNLYQQQPIQDAYQPPGGTQHPAHNIYRSQPIGDEPEPPQLIQEEQSKKARGFRARLNQHLDEGGQKTDQDIDKLWAEKDSNSHQVPQVAEDIPDEISSSEEDEEYPSEYVDQLLKMYKEDPEQLTAYQISLIEDKINESSEEKPQSQPTNGVIQVVKKSDGSEVMQIHGGMKSEDEFESDYGDHKQVSNDLDDVIDVNMNPDVLEDSEIQSSERPDETSEPEEPKKDISIPSMEDDFESSVGVSGEKGQVQAADPLAGGMMMSAGLYGQQQQTALAGFQNEEPNLSEKKNREVKQRPAVVKKRRQPPRDEEIDFAEELDSEPEIDEPATLTNEGHCKRSSADLKFEKVTESKPQ